MADTTALVPVFSGVISNTTVQLCDARALHTFMQVRRDFTTWIKGRITKFGFVAGEDFITAAKLDSPDLVNQVGHGGDRRSIEYHLTLDMAKELAMVENNAQGRAARKYFIACERELLARTMRPANPALDYDRISPAQAQDLKELVHAIVDAKVQGFSETWARLHKKFRVNSYLELPATRFQDARDYLLGKLPDEPAPAPTLRGRRWLIATDTQGRESVQPIGQDDFVTTWPALVAGVEAGECLRSNAELLAMASACTRRVQQRTLRN